MDRYEENLKWHEAHNGRSGIVPFVLEMRYPLKSYDLRTIGYEVVGAEPEAYRCACCAQQEVAFADACDLQPAHGAWIRVVGEPGQPAGFDHPILWKSRWEKRYVLTAEPYPQMLDQAVHSCRERGWPYHMFSENVGLWNPSMNGGTRLMLVSPGAWGLHLEPIIKAASAVLQPWDRGTWSTKEEDQCGA